MSSLNARPRNGLQTQTVNHYGTVVRNVSPQQKLMRLSLANLLWENQFYIDGVKTADQVANLVKVVDPQFTAQLAEVARSTFKLRHIPLLLTRELARIGKLKAQTLTNVIQRPDEMSEFLSIYWKDGKVPISAQVKKGLANAFLKFNEYSLAKWDKNSSAIKLRDVLFLVHAKPQSPLQELLFQKVAAGTLATPDTWETQLSAGADKAETFTRLLMEKKIGALAFLKNLRNMQESGVSDQLIRNYAKTLDVSKVLPFRYIAAARVVPQYENMLEAMMLRSLDGVEKLKGKTKIYIDTSGSMFGTKVSARSDLDRFDAAAALAVLCREICEEVEIFAFTTDVVRVAPRRGFALVEAIRGALPVGETDLGQALAKTKGNADRVIVFTDGESSAVGAPFCGAKGYMVNVSAYENGVSHGDWLEVNGFSEAVLSYIQAVESQDSAA